MARIKKTYHSRWESISQNQYGCATPRHRLKTPNTRTQLKSTARSQPFEKLFPNILTRYFSKSAISPLLMQYFSFPLYFHKITVFLQTSQILNFAHKNILIILNLNFIFLIMQSIPQIPTFPIITLLPPLFLKFYIFL